MGRGLGKRDAVLTIVYGLHHDVSAIKNMFNVGNVHCHNSALDEESFTQCLPMRSSLDNDFCMTMLRIYRAKGEGDGHIKTA